MKVKQLGWANYRRLPDASLQVRQHLVLVGPNDSGKSSVVRALQLCLGMTHGQLTSAVTPRDFTDPALPLRVTVTLDGIDDDDRAAFPDEVTVGTTDTLTVAVEAVVDPADPDQATTRRFFPSAGHDRAPTRDQLADIGFRYVPAARSLLRELGGGSGGAVRSLLSGLDLTADTPALTAAADSYRAALDGSDTLKAFRGELAGALSEALPKPVAEDDVRVVSEAELLDDPLSGVTVTVDEAGHRVPLAEQSDGIRALSVLTLLGMSHKAARIVAVDEPETHLHPTAQRSVARTLRAGTGQRVLVTHSPSIVAELDPMDIVAFRADRRVRQLPAGAGIAAHEKTVRHWSHQLIEPLTARRVVVVEGPADRIILEAAAQATGAMLERKGVAVVELDGADLFPFAYTVFGPDGFDILLNGLLDEDARHKWADAIGVAPAGLEAAGYAVCDPDLEAAYIDGLGVATVVAALEASPTIGANMLRQVCGVAKLDAVTRDQLLAFCGHKKRKVLSAIAVADALTAGGAAAIVPVNALLAQVT